MKARTVRSPRMLTVLLREADRGKIGEFDLGQYRDLLRQRLKRAGLIDATVIGGFEVVYKARKRAWILHINLVIIGGDRSALDRFERSFDKSEITRPVVSTDVVDRAEQLSYLLKFSTYHRPLERRGEEKSPAKPLHEPEHRKLVQWMEKFNFQDFLFLFNSRRQGMSVVLRMF